MIIRWPSSRILAISVIAAVIPLGTVHGQTPPSAAEIAAYRGLHAAAAKGDITAVRAALRDKADVDARDGHGRTALHVAAHGSHRDVIRELAKAGADMKAKDNRKYDIITIAAVQNDAATVELAVSLGSDPKAITSPYDGTALIAAAHSCVH